MHFTWHSNATMAPFTPALYYALHRDTIPHNLGTLLNLALSHHLAPFTQTLYHTRKKCTVPRATKEHCTTVQYSIWLFYFTMAPYVLIMVFCVKSSNFKIWPPYLLWFRWNLVHNWAWRQKIAILIRMQFLNDIIKSRHGFKTAQKFHKFRVL